MTDRVLRKGRIVLILRMAKFNLKIIILFLLFPFLLVGQIESYHFNRISLKENLTSQNLNYYINKDSFGYIWISSPVGLNQFNGISIKQFQENSENNNSILGNNVLSNFYNENKGALWFSTNKSIINYIPQTNEFKQFFIVENGKKIVQPYNLLFFDKESELMWIRIQNKLYRVKGKNFSQPKFIGEFAFNSTSGVIKTKGSNNYYLLLPQLNKLEFLKLSKSGEILSKKTFLEGLHSSSFIHYKKNQLYIGTNNGLFEINTKTNEKKQYPNFKDINIDQIADINLWKKNTLIVATRKNGLFFFDLKKKIFTHQIFYYEMDSLKPFKLPIDKIQITDDEILWISTSGKGIYYADLNYKKFNTYLQDERKGTFIRSIDQDKLGNLWVLTRSGIRIFNQSGEKLNIFKYFQNDTLPFYGEFPYHLFFDSKENCWISTLSGVFLLVKNNFSFERISVSPKITKNIFPVLKITELSNGKILFSSLKGIFEFNSESRLISNTNYFGENKKQAYSWVVKNKNSLILRKEGVGFEVFQNLNDSLKYDTTLIFKPFINQIRPNFDSTFFWIASSEGLFKLYTKNDCYEIVKDEILPIKIIRGLLQNHQSKNLWLATNLGIIRYNYIQKNWKIFGPTNGLPNTEFNYWSSFKTKSGNFIFGTINGLVMFDPNKIKLDSTAVTPKIFSIFVNDKVPEQSLICQKTNSIMSILVLINLGIA